MPEILIVCRSEEDAFQLENSGFTVKNKTTFFSHFHPSEDARLGYFPPPKKYNKVHGR